MVRDYSVSPTVKWKRYESFPLRRILPRGCAFAQPLVLWRNNEYTFQIMRENITFRKICDKEGRVLAGLNINNMIPVREEYLTEIDIRIHPSDSPKIKRWKKLCAKELDWCQAHQNEIERLANELYRMYISKVPFKKRKICLNFPLLEKECKNCKGF